DGGEAGPVEDGFTYDGWDVPIPSRDGGGCADNTECAPGRFCLRFGCGGPGVCVPRPDTCPTEYSPVCSCDGRTFGNACLALASGASVAYQGPCSLVDAGPDVPPAVDGGGRCL